MSIEKKEKASKSETELIEKAGRDIISKFMTRGQAKGKFGSDRDQNVNKDLWLDTDFYFSIVFQSSDQKYDFLNQLMEMLKKKGNEVELDKGNGYPVQIINGLKLGTAMGFSLKDEMSREYPLGDEKLKEFALDEETF